MLKTKNRRRLTTIAKIAILAALSVLIQLLKFPISFIAPGFYKFDFSEIIVMIGGFSMGPWAAIVIEFVKNLLNLLLEGSVTSGIGELSNFLMGSSFTFTAALIYKYNKTKKGAVISLLSGTAVLAVFSVLINYFILIPTYAAAFHTDIAKLTVFNDTNMSLFKFVLVCTLPFNLIKGITASIVTFILYKRVSPLLHL